MRQPVDEITGKQILELLEQLGRSLESERLLDECILQLLSSAGRRGLPQAQLADAIGVSPVTVSRHIDALEAKGLVSRVAHPHDRRSKLIEMTERGSTLLSDRSSRSARKIERMLDGLTSNDLSSLKNLLKIIVMNDRAPLSALGRGCQANAPLSLPRPG